MARVRPRRSPLAPVSKAAPRREHFAESERTRRYLEADELKAFFKHLSPTSFWYSYFFIQYHFGCRLSEPAYIRDADVICGKGVKAGNEKIKIKRTKKSNEKAGYREIVYPADARVMRCVDVALRCKLQRGDVDTSVPMPRGVAPGQGNPFLFASSRHRESESVGAERMSQLRNSEDGWQAVSRFTAFRTFKEIAVAVRLPENLRHSLVLRHTRAIVLLACGVSTEKVQYLLGHSSPKMTERYLNVARRYDVAGLGKELGP